jgi:hypothetical protein
LEQQKTGGSFNYKAFRNAIAQEELTPGQKVPLEQRLDTLESFMAGQDVAEGRSGGYSTWRERERKASLKSTSTATTWEPKV